MIFSNNHPLGLLVLPCRELLSRYWQCELWRVYKEKNFVADSLATYSLDLDLGTFFICDTPPCSVRFIRKDRLRRISTLMADGIMVLLHAPTCNFLHFYWTIRRSYEIIDAFHQKLNTKISTSISFIKQSHNLIQLLMFSQLFYV